MSEHMFATIAERVSAPPGWYVAYRPEPDEYRMIDTDSIIWMGPYRSYEDAGAAALAHGRIERHAGDLGVQGIVRHPEDTTAADALTRRRDH